MAADDLRDELNPLREADQKRKLAAKLEAERLARKPKTSLKAVAIAVLMCIRVKHALNERHERKNTRSQKQDANAHFRCTSSTAKVRDGSLNGRKFFY